MASCSNCAADALYVYEVTDAHEIQYCAAHLPGFLAPMLKAGKLKTTSAFESEKKSAIAALTAPVEEPVVEKSSKKKTDSEAVAEEGK